MIAAFTSFFFYCQQIPCVEIETDAYPFPLGKKFDSLIQVYFFCTSF